MTTEITNTTKMLEIGDIITTSYKTGPYKLDEISDICDCPSYNASLRGDMTPSKPHFHLTLSNLDGKGTLSYLNGYALDETGVWRCVWETAVGDDYLIVDSAGDISKYIDVTGMQMELF